MKGMSIFTILQPNSQHNYKGFYKFLIIISFVALLGAYAVEYILRLPPCELCIYQRYCYYVLIIFSAIGLMVTNNKKFLSFIFIILLSACAISGYHSGVERGIFTATPTCASQVDISDNLSVNEIKDRLYSKPVASCERAALKVIGLSMSEWNFLLNSVLLLLFLKIWNFKGKSYAKA